MEHTLEQLRERLHTLPEDVQDAIFAVETADAIGEIQAKYKLHIDQAGELAEELGLVMLGLTRPFDFVNHIATKLGITQLVATQITKDINESIFNPIKESLKRVHALDRDPQTPETKTQPSDNVSTGQNLTNDQALPENKEQTTAPTSPTSDQLFDAKLKGLFTSNSSTPTSTDPYRENLT